MMDTVIWRRHARATQVTLRIDPCLGKLVVTLPQTAPRAMARALLARHADWLRESLAALPAPPSLREGGSVDLDGVAHPIRYVPGRSVTAKGAMLNVGETGGGAAGRLLAYLRAQAEARLPPRAHAKAAAAALVPASIRVRETRARWGSCSPKGVLMFSWRLVMAPPFVQDYVLAHEVAHLRHLDHGARFWALTEALTPHRAVAEVWLQREGSALLRLGRA